MQLLSHITQIEWNKQNLDELYLVLSNGDTKKVNLQTQKVMDVKIPRVGLSKKG